MVILADRFDEGFSVGWKHFAELRSSLASETTQSIASCWLEISRCWTLERSLRTFKRESVSSKVDSLFSWEWELKEGKILREVPCNRLVGFRPSQEDDWADCRHGNEWNRRLTSPNRRDVREDNRRRLIGVKLCDSSERNRSTIRDRRKCGSERRIAITENHFLAEQIEIIHDF